MKFISAMSIALAVAPIANAENVWICNRTDSSVKFVRAEVQDFDLDVYSGEGWYVAAPGQCVNSGINRNWGAPSWLAFTDMQRRPITFKPSGADVIHNHPRKLDEICYSVTADAWHSLETSSSIFGHPITKHPKEQNGHCAQPGFENFPVSFGVIINSADLTIDLH